MPARNKRFSESWEVAHLQMIFFPRKSPRELDQDWFRDLTGKPPKEAISKPHEVVEVGAYDSLALNLTVDLLKIVFTIQPQVDPNSLTDFPALTSRPEDAIKSFLQLMGQWVDTRPRPPAIRRIGFAGRFVQRTKNPKNAYRRLKEFLTTVKLDSRTPTREFCIGTARIRFGYSTWLFIIN